MVSVGECGRPVVGRLGPPKAPSFQHDVTSSVVRGGRLLSGLEELDMGSWGPGLYANDTARDLKPFIAAMCRLPLTGAELVTELARRCSPADDLGHEDHTTFWLVLADQLHSRGVDAGGVYERAVQVIDEGSDLAVRRRLGSSERDLSVRAKKLAVLREKLTSALGPDKRKMLRRPQPLLMKVGDVLAYPVDNNQNSFNPYQSLNTAFEVQGHSALVVHGSGHVLGYLAVYQAVQLRQGLSAAPPSLDEVRHARGWVQRLPGTCSKAHFKKLRLRRLGSVELSAEHAGVFTDPRSAESKAIHDVSICNEMSTSPEPLQDPRALDEWLAQAGT